MVYVSSLMGLKPLILRVYRNSLKIECIKCGRAQVAKIGSRCLDVGKCSRCLSSEVHHLLPVWRQ